MEPKEPLSRVEQYLAAIAGGDNPVPDHPLTRIEEYLAAILEGGGGGGGGGGNVDDVQIDGTSILDENKVANIPIAAANTLGLVLNATNRGIGITQNGELYIISANDSQVKGGTASYFPIIPAAQDRAAFYGLAKAAGADEKDSTLAMGTYTETAKAAIRAMLGAAADGRVVEVEGTSPTINAENNVRYVCNSELTSLTIVAPAEGAFQVEFYSGTTPTVLTADGLSWQEWVDTSEPLESDCRYEINVVDRFATRATWPGVSPN